MTLREFIREIHRRDPILSATGWLMASGLVVAAAGLLFDSRMILGINPWIKPMKFASSIAIFLWTMAWLMEEAHPRYRRRLAILRWTFVATMIGEIVLISMQSARGTTSHFNIQTPLDAAIFSAMGNMITINTIAAAAMLTTLKPVEAARAGYQRGVRLGLLTFVIGSLQGFVMVANMAHAVPGPDGGPGLPFVNWSTNMGDLRMAHFLGLHSLQVLPVAGFFADQVWESNHRQAVRAVSVLAAAWALAMGGALALALAGQPLWRA